MAEILTHLGKPSGNETAHSSNGGGNGASREPVISLVDTAKTNPDKLIEDPFLFQAATVWTLETVQAYHREIGLIDSQVEGNRTRREEEFSERFDKLHGDQPERYDAVDKSRARRGLVASLQSTAVIWDQLEENGREIVLETVTTWIQTQETTIYSGIQVRK